MMEAIISSETSVNIHQATWHNNPKDSHLHNRYRGNLKSLRWLVFDEDNDNNDSDYCDYNDYYD
jgi:hypothetical protein